MFFVMPTREEIEQIVDDPDHGIRHNGNDHKEALANCPRCAVQSLLVRLREVEAERDAQRAGHSAMFKRAEKAEVRVAELERERDEYKAWYEIKKFDAERLRSRIDTLKELVDSYYD